MPKRWLYTAFIASLLIAFALSAFPQAAHAQEPEGERIPVEVGAYIIDAFDVNFVENQISVEFYIWFRYPKSAYDGGYDALGSFFVVNAQETSMDEPVTTEYEDMVYQIGRVTALIKKNWNVSDYPFDEHEIHMLIEDGSDVWQQVDYLHDSGNSEIDPDLDLTSWIVDDLQLSQVEKVWTSNFGDPSIESQKTTDFVRVSIAFHMTRPAGGVLLFIKAFTGVFVAVLVAFLALLVRPDELEVRTGLSVGSLFAAVGNLLVVSSVLPETSEPTFVDNLHNMSFVFIGVTALIAVLSNNLLSRDQEARALQLNKRGLQVLPILYLICTAIMVVYYYTSNLSGG